MKHSNIIFTFTKITFMAMIFLLSVKMNAQINLGVIDITPCNIAINNPLITQTFTATTGRVQANVPIGTQEVSYIINDATQLTYKTAAHAPNILKVNQVVSLTPTNNPSLLPYKVQGFLLPLSQNVYVNADHTTSIADGVSDFAKKQVEISLQIANVIIADPTLVFKEIEPANLPTAFNITDYVTGGTPEAIAQLDNLIEQVGQNATDFITNTPAFMTLDQSVQQEIITEATAAAFDCVIGNTDNTFDTAYQTMGEKGITPSEAWDCAKNAVGLGAVGALTTVGLDAAGIKILTKAVTKFLVKNAGWVGAAITVVEFTSCMYNAAQN